MEKRTHSFTIVIKANMATSFENQISCEHLRWNSSGFSKKCINQTNWKIFAEYLRRHKSLVKQYQAQIFLMTFNKNN